MFGVPLNAATAVAFGALAVALLAEAARRARWNAPAGEHLEWAVATAIVVLGHRMSVRLDTGLELHYLGSAFLALLLGYPRALLSMGLVLLVDAAWPAPAGAGPETGAVLSSWGLRLLLAGALPVWTIWWIVEASKRLLPRNLFVFLLGCGFFGLFLAYALQLAATALVYAAVAPDVPRQFLADFVPYVLLLASGEAWLEGMIVTVLVVYRPGSVRLYDEAFYLRRR